MTDKAIKIRVENFGLTPESVEPLQVQVKTYASLDELVDAGTFTLTDIITPGEL